MGHSIEFIAGPFLVFVCLGLILFGTFTAQFYYYWMSYENDRLTLKIFVWSLGIMELFHTIFCIMFLYSYLIANFGDASSGLDRVVWTIRATVFIEITIVIMTQSLYVSRIWQLSNKSIAVTGIPLLCVLGRLAFGAASFAFLCLFDTWAEFGSHRPLQVTLNCAFALELLTDAIISAELIWYLSVRRTQFARTRDVIQKLMYWIINTGVITIIFSAAVLVAFNVTRGSLLFMGIIEMISKLYANTNLAMLNARRKIRNGISDFNTVELPESRARETHIQIYTETEVINEQHAIGRLSSQGELSDTGKMGKISPYAI